MREIQWCQHRLIEIRVAAKHSRLRYALAPHPRNGSGTFRHEPYDEAPAQFLLPGFIQPALNRRGEPVDLRPLVSELVPRGVVFPIELLLSAEHPLVIQTGQPGEPQIVPAAWLSNVPEPAVDAIRTKGDLLSGLLINADESVLSLGNSLQSRLWLQRLPRIVLPSDSEIADNTDAMLSMGSLLHGFVHRFSDKEHALAHVRVATGYLYQQGLARILSLLDNPVVQTVHLLFSGRTDSPTARALTSQLGATLRDELDAAEQPNSLWTKLERAVREKRFTVRVYTDAFLHAKLFIGFNGIDRHRKLRDGYAVVGSSNVTAPGLRAGGNLELDVSVVERSHTTQLYNWFVCRWDEASDPEPSLLEVLEQSRPLPPPTFVIPGVLEVWKQGRRGALVPPAEHLALLSQLYAARLKGLELPSDESFPDVPERLIDPTEEQREGVLALAQRLQQTRIAFLADSVGLGKTITSLGTAAFMLRNGLAERVALIAPEKLRDQWASDAARVGIPISLVQFVNRHILERMTDADAKAALHPFDLIVVEEAHEPLRNRKNKLWQHLRQHLRERPECRLLLVSATPWNNSREDIFNFLLLAWNEGRSLGERYPALSSPPLSGPLSNFRVTPYGGMPVSEGVRGFDELPRDRYRQVFDAVFVQRTRSMLETRMARALDFPQRLVHAHNTPPSETHDRLFAALADELPKLCIPYQEPFHAFLRGAHTLHSQDEDEPESNLRRSFIIQLYKRAESSLFALGVSLSTVRLRLQEFRTQLAALGSAANPKAAVEKYLKELSLRSEAVVDEDGEYVLDLMSPAEKARYASLQALLQRLTPENTRQVIQRIIDEQVTPDLDAISRLLIKLSFSVDEQSPKDLLLMRLAREAYTRGHKPILIAGYADTATRTFIRVVDLIPDARVALVLGGSEAWVYKPGDNKRIPLGEAEWDAALALSPDERRRSWLANMQRAERATAADVLDAFAPNARRSSPLLFSRFGGPIDVLVGSEAISVGHNLQDSTCLIQLDLPWNPMVIEQRIGRIDRRGGGRENPAIPQSRRIVDVHYCWSDAAVEREVALRNRLQGKATRAIEDTNFDEILLYELADRVQRVREERSKVAAAADVLGTHQHKLAESRGRSPDVPITMGSELDGLRRLAAWIKDNPSLEHAEPVIAAGSKREDAGTAWSVTLELVPLDRRGNTIPGGPLHVNIPLNGTSQEPDLEGVVLALTENVEPTGWPLVKIRRWTELALDLDGKLQLLRQRLLESHNAETAARLQAQLTPAAKREPTTKLKLLIVESRDALKNEVKRIRQTPLEATLATKKDKLAYLLKTGLEPQRLADLLAEQGETELHQLLLQIRDFPANVLGQEFDEIFDRLCGSTWAARGAAPVQLDLPQIDGQWSELKVRLLAATFHAPAASENA